MPVSVARGFESPGRVEGREAQRGASGSDEVRGGVYGGGEPAGHHWGNNGTPTTAQMLPVVTDDLAQVPAYAGDVSTGHVTSGQAAASGESETKDGNGVSATSLVAGAAAAATSSVIGGQLGAAGTVLGAGLASVVTAVAVTFYSRGLDKGREKVQRAVAKIGPVPNAKDGRTIAIATEEPLTWRQKLRRKRVLYPVVIGAATFLVGIGAVVVAEQVTENDISPGTSQISRSITGDASGGEGTSGTGETGAGETGTGDTGGSTGSNGGADQQGTGQQVPADEGGSGTDDGTGDQEGTGEQGTGQDGSGDRGTGQDSGTGTGQESDSGAGEGSGAGGSSDSGGSSGSGSSDGGSAGSGGSGGGAGGDANSQGGGSMESGSGSGSDTSAQGAGQKSGTADDA